MEKSPSEKLIFTKLVNEFSAFYRNRRRITVFTRACKMFLSSSRWIPTTPSNTPLWSIL